MSAAASDTPNPIEHEITRRPGWPGFVFGVLLAAIVCWPLILSGMTSVRGGNDDQGYHWPAIQKFADELPNPDLSDYSSATSPGYHLTLSVPTNLGAPRMMVQFISWSMTAVLFGGLGAIAWRRAGPIGALTLLPLMSSTYVMDPGVWLLPDNAGWAGVLGVMMMGLTRAPRVRTLAAGGVALMLVVFVRQVHIWVASALWVSAWIGTGASVPGATSVFRGWRFRSFRLIVGFIAAVPAAMVLLWLINLWGGLVPPQFQDQHQGPNLVTPAFILTQIALVSVCFLLVLWPALKSLAHDHAPWLIGACVLGLILGIVPESGYSVDAGRYSGWWNLIGKLPTIAERSPMIMIGAPIGAMALVVWGSTIQRRDAWIIGISLLAFVLAQTANHASWQRYHEPFILILLILVVTRAKVIAPRRPIAISVTILTLINAGISIRNVSLTEPAPSVPRETQTPPSIGESEEPARIDG